MNSKKTRLVSIFLLQIAVIIYTFAGILGKLASGKELFSVDFFLLYGGEILVLGIYAILWQQLISRFDLSVAYANRSLSLFWTSLWAIFLFHEQLTPANLAGILLVILGTLLINCEGTKKGEKHES